MITGQNNLASMVAQYRAQQPQQVTQPVTTQPAPQQPDRAERIGSLWQQAANSGGLVGGLSSLLLRHPGFVSRYGIEQPQTGVGMQRNWF